MQFIVDNVHILHIVEIVLLMIGFYFLYKREASTYAIFVSFSIFLILLTAICQWRLGVRGPSKVVLVFTFFVSAVLIAFLYNRWDLDKKLFNKPPKDEEE